MRHLVTFT